MNYTTFLTLCNKNNFSISEREYQLLEQFVQLLIEWNSKINLISRKDEENIWNKHILGSLALLFTHEFKANASIVDVGTGGGFPGIPLAICMPSASFLLVDSIKKKITVVSDVIEKLGLKNAETLCGRAEEINRKAVYNRKYDYVTARAVAPIADIIGWTTFFLRTPVKRGADAEETTTKKRIEPGTIVIYKGGDLSAELQQAQIKHKPQSLESVPLIISGIDPMEFSDKKLVFVKP